VRSYLPDLYAAAAAEEAPRRSVATAATPTPTTTTTTDTTPATRHAAAGEEDPEELGEHKVPLQRQGAATASPGTAMNTTTTTTRKSSAVNAVHPRGAGRKLARSPLQLSVHPYRYAKARSRSRTVSRNEVCATLRVKIRRRSSDKRYAEKDEQGVLEKIGTMKGRHGLEGIKLENIYTLGHLEDPDRVVTSGYAEDLDGGHSNSPAPTRAAVTGAGTTTCLALLSAGNSSSSSSSDGGATPSTSEDALEAQIMVKRLSQRQVLAELDHIRAPSDHVLALSPSSSDDGAAGDPDARSGGVEQKEDTASEFDEAEEAMMMV